MSVKLSQSIPEMVPDGSNPQAMTDYLVAVKQCVEELSRKCQSLQEEERTSVPTANDLDVNEFVHAYIGALRYLYTKTKDGTVHFIAVT